MSTKPIAACYSVSCMDPRERIVEARFSKMLHLMDAMERKVVKGQIAKQLQELRYHYGSSHLELAVNFYRDARAGGGWSLDARGDLQTIKDNGLPVLAIYSTRHRQCAAVKVNRHFHDQDVAVMVVEDCASVGIELPPVFRAHLEVVSKHERFDHEPMNLSALVAYALIHRVSRNFCHELYDPARAALLLKLDKLSQAELKSLADQVHMTPKGMSAPTVELDDLTDAH